MYKHKVQYYETDMMGITHHSNYIRWMEEARTALLDDLGWPYARMELEGIISPTIHIECDYKKTCTYEDVICIEPVVYEFKGVKIKFKYTMTMESDGSVVCVGKSEHCFIDSEGKPISIKKVKPALYELIVSNVVSE